ncbi:MAG TPA: hypothetical protein VLH35_06255 [Candidatus Acidoferrales bacterium]|nr:hypothetical protein [Candidatus Acidoferrales bacterium]
MASALGILGWIAYEQLSAGVWYSSWALLGGFLMLFSSQAFLLAATSARVKRMESRVTRSLEK